MRLTQFISEADGEDRLDTQIERLQDRIAREKDRISTHIDPEDDVRIKQAELRVGRWEIELARLKDRKEEEG